MHTYLLCQRLKYVGCLWIFLEEGLLFLYVQILKRLLFSWGQYWRRAVTLHIYPVLLTYSPPFSIAQGNIVENVGWAKLLRARQSIS